MDSRPDINAFQSRYDVLREAGATPLEAYDIAFHASDVSSGCEWNPERPAPKQLSSWRWSEVAAGFIIAAIFQLLFIGLGWLRWVI